MLVHARPSLHMLRMHAVCTICSSVGGTCLCRHLNLHATPLA